MTPTFPYLIAVDILSPSIRLSISPHQTFRSALARLVASVDIQVKGGHIHEKPQPGSMDGPEEARGFLGSLINKNLRILTTDGRLFRGAFKCTDPVGPHSLSGSNAHALLLSLSLSKPSTFLFLPVFLSGFGLRRVQRWVPKLTCPACQDTNVVIAQTYEYRRPTKRSDKADGDMTSRFLGLVVVPGEHIVRMEVEEFASQLRGGII